MTDIQILLIGVVGQPGLRRLPLAVRPGALMNALDILAGIAAAFVFVYLLWALAAARGLLMWPADFLTCRAVCSARPAHRDAAPRRLHLPRHGGRARLPEPVLRPVERAIYRICGIDETVEQGWKGYTVSVLVMARRGHRRWLHRPPPPGRAAAQPERHSAPMSPDLAFNTAVSFETNTNWQNYSGESGRQLPDPGRRPGRAQLHLRGRRASRSRSPWSAA